MSLELVEHYTVFLNISFSPSSLPTLLIERKVWKRGKKKRDIEKKGKDGGRVRRIEEGREEGRDGGSESGVRGE